MTKFRHMAAVATLIAVTSAAGAQQTGFQDLDALDALVATALGAGIGEPGGAARPIDRRLRLSPCPVTPSVDAPARGVSAVRCGADGWRIVVALMRGGPAAGEGVAATDDAPVTSAGPPIIRRGDQVQLVVLGQGFVVATSAIATEDAAIGQRTRVTVEGRRAPVFGTVMADGRVRL